MLALHGAVGRVLLLHRVMPAFLVHLGPVINDALERRGREQRHVQNIAEAVQESRMERGAIRFVLDHEP